LSEKKSPRDKRIDGSGKLREREQAQRPSIDMPNALITIQ